MTLWRAGNQVSSTFGRSDPRMIQKHPVQIGHKIFGRSSGCQIEERIEMLGLRLVLSKKLPDAADQLRRRNPLVVDVGASRNGCGCAGLSEGRLEHEYVGGS